MSAQSHTHTHTKEMGDSRDRRVKLDGRRLNSLLNCCTALTIKSKDMVKYC